MTWRTGKKAFRTIYEELPDGTSRLIGLMDTPEMARLAACAPELLEALKEMVREIGDVTAGQMANAAIAKAEAK
jgi:hypothetical protein